MDVREKLKFAKFVAQMRGSVSQRKFAAKIGVSYYSVNQWEAGISSPSPENMRKLAKACDLTVDQIWERVSSKSTEQAEQDYKEAEDIFFLARQLSLFEQIKLMKLLAESIEKQFSEIKDS